MGQSTGTHPSCQFPPPSKDLKERINSGVFYDLLGLEKKDLVRKHFSSYALVGPHGGWKVTPAIPDSIQIRSQLPV